MLELVLSDFDIEQIAESGQCFRMYRHNENEWEIFAIDRKLKIKKTYYKDIKVHFFYCTQKDFDNFWVNYFDLQTDYGQIKQRIFDTKDTYLQRAIEYGNGLRILKQDTWEMIVSFVISQQNNIPRIKNCLQNLCKINNGNFPMPSDFLKFKNEELSSIKLGYREEYLLKISVAVENGEFDIKRLKNMTYEDAIKYLKILRGVGEKVANCIALFGLHKIEAFPMDVWIKRILENRYKNSFSLNHLHLQDIGGIVQQYMYFYEKNKANNP